MFDPRKGVALFGVLSLALSAWAFGDAQHSAVPRDGDQKLVLTGLAERPNKVMTGATGSAEFDYSDHGDINYTVTVKDLSSAPTEAHIHGPADADGTGPVIAQILLSDSAKSGTIAKGKISMTSNAQISLDSLKTLIDHGKAYINVHTKNYPEGEIRGQFKH